MGFMADLIQEKTPNDCSWCGEEMDNASSYLDFKVVHNDLLSAKLCHKCTKKAIKLLNEQISTLEIKNFSKKC